AGGGRCPAAQRREVPLGLGDRRHLGAQVENAHGRRQERPSASMSSSASSGPHDPASYSGMSEVLRAKASRIGSTIFHCSSTSSRRVNNVASPRSASRSSVSYASGASAMKDAP